MTLSKRAAKARELDKRCRELIVRSDHAGRIWHADSGRSAALSLPDVWWKARGGKSLKLHPKCPASFYMRLGSPIYESRNWRRPVRAGGAQRGTYPRQRLPAGGLHMWRMK